MRLGVGAGGAGDALAQPLRGRLVWPRLKCACARKCSTIPG